ncbi:MAG: hypothetical protein Q7W05_13015, partial [Deltaproteobacteria bacterium]|nr:hypothetical protein [Deltaproteobacteria bacterium]
SKNCCGTFRCQHPLPRGVRALWDKKIKPAQKLITKVSQPLKEELIRHNPKLKYLFIPKP